MIKDEQGVERLEEKKCDKCGWMPAAACPYSSHQCMPDLWAMLKRIEALEERVGNRRTNEGRQPR